MQKKWIILGISVIVGAVAIYFIFFYNSDKCKNVTCPGKCDSSTGTCIDCTADADCGTGETC